MNLPERQKQVFQLHREKGLTYSEIAEQLGISKNTVENHMVNALKYLRQNMDNSLLINMLFISLFIWPVFDSCDYPLTCATMDLSCQYLIVYLIGGRVWINQKILFFFCTSDSGVNKVTRITIIKQKNDKRIIHSIFAGKLFRGGFWSADCMDQGRLNVRFRQRYCTDTF